MDNVVPLFAAYLAKYDTCASILELRDGLVAKYARACWLLGVNVNAISRITIKADVCIRSSPAAAVG